MFRGIWSIVSFFVVASATSTACASSALARLALVMGLVDLVFNLFLYRAWFPRTLHNIFQVLCGAAPEILLESTHEHDAADSSAVSLSGTTDE